MKTLVRFISALLVFTIITGTYLKPIETKPESTQKTENAMIKQVNATESTTQEPTATEKTINEEIIREETTETTTMTPTTEEHTTIKVTEKPTNPTSIPETTGPQLSSHEMSEMEREVFDLVNQRRAENGVEPLIYDATYYPCAKTRATEITVLWSHTRPDGTKFSTVFEEYGLINTCASVGENLAKNFKTADSIMNTLMNSSSHRENILRPEYDAIAIAIIPDNAENPTRYFMAQEFINYKK